MRTILNASGPRRRKEESLPISDRRPIVNSRPPNDLNVCPIHRSVSNLYIPCFIYVVLFHRILPYYSRPVTIASGYEQRHGWMLVHRLAYNGDVAQGQLALFQGGPSRTGGQAAHSQLFLRLALTTFAGFLIRRTFRDAAANRVPGSRPIDPA
jgi:hypothetical protein